MRVFVDWEKAAGGGVGSSPFSSSSEVRKRTILLGRRSMLGLSVGSKAS